MPIDHIWELRHGWKRSRLRVCLVWEHALCFYLGPFGYNSGDQTVLYPVCMEGGWMRLGWKGNSATVSSKLPSSIIYSDAPATAFSRLGLRGGGAVTALSTEKSDYLRRPKSLWLFQLAESGREGGGRVTRRRGTRWAWPRRRRGPLLGNPARPGSGATALAQLGRSRWGACAARTRTLARRRLKGPRAARACAVEATCARGVWGGAQLAAS